MILKIDFLINFFPGAEFFLLIRLEAPNKNPTGLNSRNKKLIYLSFIKQTRRRGE